MSPKELKRVRRIFLRLRGARGVSEDELWQYAIFFSKTPDERSEISLQSARLTLAAGRKKSPTILPSLEGTISLLKEKFGVPRRRKLSNKK